MFDMFATGDSYKIKKAIYLIGSNLHTYSTITEEDKVVETKKEKDKKELKELLIEFKKSIDFWEGKI